MEQEILERIYNLYRKSDGVSIDTRTIQQNQLFFSISGENFDGNKFAQKAIEKGAIACIVSDNKLKGKQYVFVENVCNFPVELKS